MIPKYPIYIVDATEVDQYTKATDERYGNVIIQPQKYYDDYDMFWEDTNKVTGPGAARNFAWDHSIEKGFDFHWVMDDNIQGFARLNRNKKYKVTSASIFRAMEDFVDRYENIAMAGPNYRFFASQNSKLPPFSMNTRIYSCNLIRNAFLQNKVGTQQVKGGNTEQFYSKEGTYLKSKMLLDMHPDLTKLVYKFGRPHHFVDYTPFRKNKLKRKDNITVSKGINEYGMRLNSCPK